MLLRKITFLVKIIFFITSGFALANEEKETNVVYRLYKDYSWQAIFSETDIFGGPVQKQSIEVLKKYFSMELSVLLKRDDQCNQKNLGISCRLDFDPIFYSQDSEAKDLVIYPEENNKIKVEFIYPSTGEKTKIYYSIQKTNKGWRISDITYKDGISLKEILNKK